MKIPQSLPFKKGFLEKDFCSFENSLLGCSKDLFQKKCLGGQCQLLCYESQCPKITDLSKALKAKLSSIPSGVISLSLPNLDQNGGGKTTTIVVGPHSTTCRGESSRARGAPLEGPSRYDGVVCARLPVLSLSLSLDGGGYLSTFGFMAGIWAKF